MFKSMTAMLRVFCLLLLLLPLQAQKKSAAKPAPQTMTQEVPDTGKLALLAGAAQEVGFGESSIRTARLNNDADAMAKLLAAGYITTSAEGELLDRTALLAAVKRGDSHYYSISLSDMAIHRFGPFLYVITAREDLGGKDDKGTDFVRSRRYTRVWQKQAVGWRAIACQETPVEDSK
ncbi:MAG: nuclear transport factor 2 family protein [Terriglobales bacterium]|jgi:ketosteroid isomerase-like protein